MSRTVSPVWGVLGGSGPLATAEFHQRVVRTAARAGAVQDWEYPVLLVSSSPVPGLDARGTLHPRAAHTLLERARVLAEAGATTLVAPCNTIHAILEDAPLPLPLLSIVSAAVNEVSHHSRVGVLGSRTTRDMGLYRHPLAARGVDVLEASDAQQQDLDLLISDLMGGRGDASVLERLVGDLTARGAETVLLACTELSLLRVPRTTDALDVLAARVAARSTTALIATSPRVGTLENMETS